MLQWEIHDVSNKASIPIVAVDDGYAQTKLVGQSPTGEGLVSVVIRSSVRPGRYGLSSLGGARSSGSYRTEEGEDYTVSDDVEGESTQFDGFHTSPLNRVLVNHALATAGYGGMQVRVIAGLPVADFFLDGGLDKEKIEAKKLNLSKGVSSTSAGKVATLSDIRIGCQAIAAFVDYLLDDDLNERDVPKKTIAVVDIGGRTTDIAVVKGGNSFDESKSGTTNLGVLDVYELISRSIRTKFGTRDKYPLAVLDSAVRERKVVLWGEEHDLSEEVDAAVREQEVKIAREVERRLGSASAVDKVVFVGGGAALFSNVSAHFRNGVIAPDPEFANARGLFKYARRFS